MSIGARIVRALFAGRRSRWAFEDLSIIDLEDGQQPMESADGNLHIVFNGEIYDYKELRAETQAFGISFCTHSDTDFSINTIQLYGEKALNKSGNVWVCCME